MRTRRYRTIADIGPFHVFGSTDSCCRYKIGDVFVSLPLSEVQELLASSTTSIDAEVTVLESQLGSIRDEKEQLKVALYARFGRSINLET